MTSPPETRDSLLLQVRDHGNATAWQEFVAIYRPMIYRLARRGGLQDSDAEDLAQRVLVSVSRAIGEWEKDPERGSFRSWLATVARNAMINMATRGPKEAAVGGSEFLQVCRGVASSCEIDELIRREHQRSLLRLAAARVQATMTESTWQSFWQTAVEGKSIEQTARDLNVTVGAVYGARCRVMKQLQAAASELQTELTEED